jgi:hypothetical protein
MIFPAHSVAIPALTGGTLDQVSSATLTWHATRFARSVCTPDLLIVSTLNSLTVVRHYGKKHSFVDNGAKINQQ